MQCLLVEPMDFCKSLTIGSIHIYVSSYQMKRKSRREENYAYLKKKLMRMKHERWKLTGGRCEECGRSLDEELLQVHHIVPVSVRPDLYSAWSNLHLVCPECHARLHQGQPEAENEEKE